MNEMPFQQRAELIKQLSEKGELGLNALQAATELMPQHFQLAETKRSPHRLQVYLHGLRLVFRVEISLESQAGKTFIRCHFLSSTDPKETQLGIGREIPEFTGTDENIKTEAAKFAQHLLKAFSDDLSKAGLLKLE